MVLANNIEGRGRQLLLPYAIYGAFAFLAMVLEKNDFFVAAGCVLLVAASVMGLYFYKKDQSLVSLSAFCFLDGRRGTWRYAAK